METELFVHFAEIAGVFVGFGALISVRSAQVTDLHDVVYLQGVLGLGIWVVISALLPIAVNRYGVDGHALWLSCALVAIAVWAVIMIVYTRTPDTRAYYASTRIHRSSERVDRLFPIVGLPLHVVIAGSMAVIVIGVWRDLDEALYVTGLTAGVVFAGYTLLALVMSQRHQSRPDSDQERLRDTE
jgi:hypothetical protein